MRRPSPGFRALGACALSGLTAFASWPYPALAADLRGALTSAYQTNPDLDAERASLRATDELVPQALDGYRPEIFVNGTLEGTRGEAGTGGQSATQEILSELGVGGTGSSTSSDSIKQTEKTISLTATQNLYAGGGTRASVRRAENLVRAGRASLIATEQDTLLSAVQAYADAWAAQSTLELALNNEQRLTRQLDATRDRFEVGEVARTDVAQAEARLSRARADVEAAKANLATANASYIRVIGQEPSNLDDPRPLEQLPRSLMDARATAANNPDIAAATYNLRAADNDVRVAIANLLPSLDLNASAIASDQPNSETPWQRTAAVGLQLTIPLYQGGAEYSQVRQNREIVKQRRDQLESANRSVQDQVSAAYDNLLAARAAIEAFESEVEANEVALDGVQQEALVGARTVLDVLDAEQELFTSQVNLVNARRDAVVASYNLKAAVGELTAADLGLDVVAYDAEAYTQRNRSRLFGLDGGG
jgi:TolC family type I secretion outer membrane protein